MALLLGWGCGCLSQTLDVFLTQTRQIYMPIFGLHWHTFTILNNTESCIWSSIFYFYFILFYKRLQSQSVQSIMLTHTRRSEKFDELSLCSNCFFRMICAQVWHYNRESNFHWSTADWTFFHHWEFPVLYLPDYNVVKESIVYVHRWSPEYPVENVALPSAVKPIGSRYGLN